MGAYQRIFESFVLRKEVDSRTNSKTVSRLPVKNVSVTMSVIKQKNADYDQICSRLFCSHEISDWKTIHWITQLAKNPFNYKLCQLAELRKRLQTCKSSCVHRWIIDCKLQITNKDEIAQKCFWYTLIKKGENFKQKHTLMTVIITLIMCGVNKGTYTKSSIGCGCFDWND